MNENHDAKGRFAPSDEPASSNAPKNKLGVLRALIRGDAITLSPRQLKHAADYVNAQLRRKTLPKRHREKLIMVREDIRDVRGIRRDEAEYRGERRVTPL